MGSWDISFFFFFLSPSLPPNPYGRLSYVGFTVGRLEKRQRPPFPAYWGGKGGRKQWNVQLYFQPPLPPPLFISLRHR